MKTLIAGPWSGSLLGELMCWQGWLRQLSKKYTKTIVVAPKDKRILYEDFASSIVSKVPSIKDAEHVTSRDVPVNFISMQPSVDGQQFVMLGQRQDPKYHVAIEADMVYPLDRKQWASITCKLDEHLDVAWLSDGLNCHAIYGDDLRGVPFSVLHEAILASKVVVAPSGGIAALALLSGVPTITWIDRDQVSLYGTTKWNPHSVPGTVFKGKPTVKQIEDAIHRMISVADKEPEPAEWVG